MRWRQTVAESFPNDLPSTHFGGFYRNPGGTMRIGCMTFIAALTLMVPCFGQGTLSTVAASIPTRAGNYDKLRVSFEPNHDLTDARVQFLSHHSGHVLFLTSTEAV